MGNFLLILTWWFTWGRYAIDSFLPLKIYKVEFACYWCVNIVQGIYFDVNILQNTQSCLCYLLWQAGKTLSARRWHAAFSQDGHLDIAPVLRRIQRGVIFLFRSFETCINSLHFYLAILGGFSMFIFSFCCYMETLEP